MYLVRKFYLLFLAGLILVPVSFASAEVTVERTTEVLADVSLRDCSMKGQETKELSLECSFLNKKGIQPGIRYSVKLITTQDNVRVTLDEKVYDKTLILYENEPLKESFTYSVPSFSEENAEVWVTARTEEGVSLANVSLGKIKGIPQDGALEIINPSCYLKVEGEAGDKKYTLLQGVDVDAQEKIIAFCEIKNLGKTAVTYTPKFETYLRNIFGKVTVHTGEENPHLTLAPNERKSVYFTLPKAANPQAYDVVLSLTDGAKTALSNRVSFHYVLRGASATIQNIGLDKDMFLKGEKANFTVFWTESADTHRTSRKEGTESGATLIRVALLDGKGAQCAELTNHQIATTTRERASSVPFEITVTKNCIDPTITTQIIDKDGKILTEKNISLTSKNASEELRKESLDQASGGVVEFMQSPLFLVIVALTIVGFGIAGVVAFRNKRRGLKSLAFLLIFLSGAFVSSSAQAATFKDIWLITSFCDEYGVCGEERIDSQFTVDLDKSTYSPGETIQATGFFVDSICTDGAILGGNLDVVNQADGQFSTLLTNASSGVQNSVNFVAPSTPGSYRVTFSGGTSGIGNNSGFAINLAAQGFTIPKTSYDVWYTVSNPSTDGTCGTAHGQSFPSAPAANLCGYSSSSPVVSGSGPWNWTCTGLSGGVDVNCSANPNPPTVDLKINGSDGPLTVLRNDNLNITWGNVANGTSCSGTGAGWTGMKSMLGGNDNIPATATDTYQITCTGPGGTTVDSVPVTLSSTLKICENSCSSGIEAPNSFVMVQGTSGNYVACFNDAASCTDGSGNVTSGASWSEDTGSNVITLTNGDPKTVNATRRGTENFSSSYGGQTQTKTVAVTCTDAGACSRDGRTANLCQTDTFTVVDLCGDTQNCTGTKTCDYNWKEVAP